MQTDSENLYQPSLYNETQAAAFLSTTRATLKYSRHTGKLWGENAPEYLKINRTIRYKRTTLSAWISQFSEQQNTVT